MANKKQQLPQGQITPVARPLGSFIQPGQQQTAGAAAPPNIPNPSKIATLQKAGVGRVQGYNKFEQLSNALGNFTPTAISAAQTIYEDYAKRTIEDEYYKTLKNEDVKARLSLQIQAEKSAAGANQKIDELNKVDPIAALLLDEANPWKLIGRRRALAQYAAAEIDNAFDNDFSGNKEALSIIKPGSGELTKRRVEIQKAVQDKYGFTGDEPEYLYYVVPKENKAFDDYSDKHEKLYHQQIKISSKETSVAALTFQIDGLIKDGIVIGPTGEYFKTGSPEFNQIGGRQLTTELDKTLSLFAGKDKQDVLESITEELGGYVGTGLIEEIRLGSSTTPYDKRPRYGDVYPGTLLDIQSKNLDRQQKIINGKNKKFEARTTELFNELAFSFPVGSDERRDAIKQIDEQMRAEGFFGAREILKNLNDTDIDYQDDFDKQPVGQTQVEEAEFIDGINPNSFKDQKSIGNLYEEASKLAKKYPSDLQDSARLRIFNKIKDKRNDFEKLPSGTTTRINNAVKQYLSHPAIDGLEGGQNFARFQQAYGFTNDLTSSVLSGSQKFSELAIKVNDEITIATSDAYAAWRNDPKNEGKILSPSENIKILRTAISDFNKSEAFRTILSDTFDLRTKDGVEKANAVLSSYAGKDAKRFEKILTEEELKQKDFDDFAAGKHGLPVGKDAPDAGDAMDGGGILPKGQERDISDFKVKTYRREAILKGRTIYTDLNNIKNGQPLTGNTLDIANRARITPEKLLLEQLKFYPSLDPSGEIETYLKQKVSEQKNNGLISQAWMNGNNHWAAEMIFGAPLFPIAKILPN